MGLWNPILSEAAGREKDLNFLRVSDSSVVAASAPLPQNGSSGSPILSEAKDLKEKADTHPER